MELTGTEVQGGRKDAFDHEEILYFDINSRCLISVSCNTNINCRWFMCPCELILSLLTINWDVLAREKKGIYEV